MSHLMSRQCRLRKLDFPRNPPFCLAGNYRTFVISHNVSFLLDVCVFGRAVRSSSFFLFSLFWLRRFSRERGAPDIKEIEN